MISEKSIDLPRKKVFSGFILQLLFIMFSVEFVKGALLISILPAYMASVLGLSAFVIGLSFSLQYLGDNLFRSPIGWIIDHFGLRISMLAGLIISLASVSIIALTTSFLWIIIACALMGIGTSPLWPCVVTAATEAAGDKARGTIMSLVYMVWLGGVGLGPVVINFFIGDSYITAFRILIILMISVILVSIFLPARKAKEMRRHSTIKEGISRLKSRISATDSLVKGRWKKIKQYFSEASKSLNVGAVFYLAMFAQTLALGILTPVLTLYARTQLHLTGYEYSLFLISGGALTVLFLIPVGKLVDKWGTKWFLHIGFALSSLILLFFTFAQSLTILLMLVGLLGIGYALIIPSWNALIAAAIPASKRGAIWGFFLTIEGSGMIVGPIISGKLWDTLSYHAPFIASGIVLFCLFFLHIFISNKKKMQHKTRKL